MSAQRQTIALYALGAPGAELCRRLATELDSTDVFLPARHARQDLAESSFESLHAILAENFKRYSGHVLVCAAGMAIRCFAPLMQGKDKDPAVVVLDQHGKYAVSLLSGHLGGANDLATRVAQELGGQAVITTATDNLGLPSLELEAKRLGMKVENLSALAAVSGALVDGRKVALCDPGGWLSPVTDDYPYLFKSVEPDQAEGMTHEPMVWVGWQYLSKRDGWLILRPRCLVLGMGCNRSTRADELLALANEALSRTGAAKSCLKTIASAEAKQNEPGLLETARSLGVEPIFYDHDKLAQVEVPNPSEAARRCLGTASVCEAAAILASHNGPLILNKIKSKNATAAVAVI
jgi:cobalt-precorrin 5A hydrolase